MQRSNNNDLKHNSSVRPHRTDSKSHRKSGTSATPREDTKRVSWCWYDRGKDRGCGNKSCKFRHAHGLCKKADCQLKLGCFWLHPNEVTFCSGLPSGYEVRKSIENLKVPSKDKEQYFYNKRQPEKLVRDNYGDFGKDLIKAARNDVGTSDLVQNVGRTLGQRFTDMMTHKYNKLFVESGINTEEVELHHCNEPNDSNRTIKRRASAGDVVVCKNKFEVLDSPKLDENKLLDREDKALCREERWVSIRKRRHHLEPDVKIEQGNIDTKLFEQELRNRKLVDEIDNLNDVLNIDKEAKFTSKKFEMTDNRVKTEELVGNANIRRLTRKVNELKANIDEIRVRGDIHVATKELSVRESKLQSEAESIPLDMESKSIKLEIDRLKLQKERCDHEYFLQGGDNRKTIDQLSSKKKILEAEDALKFALFEKNKQEKVYSTKRNPDPYSDYMGDRATVKGPTRHQVNELYARGYRPAGRIGPSHCNISDAHKWNDIVPCTCDVLRGTFTRTQPDGQDLSDRHPRARNLLSVPPFEQLHRAFCAKSHGDDRTKDWYVVKIGEHFEPLAWFLKSKYFFSQRDPRVIIPSMVVDARNWMLSRGYSLESYRDYDILVNAIRAAYEADPLELFFRQHIKDTEILDGVSHVNASAIGESQTGLFKNPFGHTSLANKLGLTNTLDVTDSIKKSKV